MYFINYVRYINVVDIIRQRFCTFCLIILYVEMVDEHLVKMFYMLLQICFIVNYMHSVGKCKVLLLIIKVKWAIIKLKSTSWSILQEVFLEITIHTLVIFQARIVFKCPLS